MTRGDKKKSDFKAILDRQGISATTGTYKDLRIFFTYRRIFIRKRLSDSASRGVDDSPMRGVFF
jgi:hypothetical protein